MAQVGALVKADFGRVMGLAAISLKVQAEGQAINGTVKRLLEAAYTQQELGSCFS